MFQQTSTRIIGGAFAIAALVIAFLLLNNFLQQSIDPLPEFASIGVVTPVPSTQPQLILSDGRSVAGWHTQNINFDGISYDYETGIDTAVSHQGNHSGYIKSNVDDPVGYKYLYQTIQADAYRGQRIRITTALKIEQMEGLTGIEATIYNDDGTVVNRDGPRNSNPGISNRDNPRDSSFKGTQDWQLKEIVIDVPDSSAYISFSFYLEGSGQVWADDWQVEIVTSDVDTTNDARELQNLNMEVATVNGEPQSWSLIGVTSENYQISLDNSIFTEGNSSALLQSDIPSITGFGNLMQTVLPDAFRGKRVRFSGEIRSEEAQQVAPWMRVVGIHGQILQFDDSNDRFLSGTQDWTPFEIVLDVPEESINIGFGLMSHGKGMGWIDNMQLEIVGEDVPSTSSVSITSPTSYSMPFQKKLRGVDEQPRIATPSQGWFEAGSQPEAYTMAIDSDVLSPESDMPSLYIRGNTAEALGTGALAQAVSAEDYRGQRVRLTVYLRSDGIVGQAMPFLSIGFYDIVLAKAGAGNLTLSGSQEWTPYELVLDVPDAAIFLTLGVSLKDAGTVWIGDVQLETVGDDVPTMNLFDVEAPVNLGFEE